MNVRVRVAVLSAVHVDEADRSIVPVMETVRSSVHVMDAVLSDVPVRVFVGTILTTGVTGVYDEFFASWQHA